VPRSTTFFTSSNSTFAARATIDLMDVAPKSLRKSVVDLLLIPEDERRHEVIAGERIKKEAASGRHGGAQVRLARNLGPFDRRPGKRSPGGWWFASEVEIALQVDEVYRPDLAGWRRERMERLPKEVPISLRPDWVCEILSTKRRIDFVKKKRAYHRHQVGHYWLLDPEEETLSVNRWHPDGYVEVLVADRSERVRAEPFEAIEISLAVLFGDDPVDEDEDGS
jgi:Uma2 family endonuclease